MPPRPFWPERSSGPLEGPWDQGFYFVLHGAVASKSNYRHSVAGRKQWATLKAFAEHVRLAARAARPRGWDIGDPSVPLPARTKVICCIFARSMLDVGNLDKSILDAVESTPARDGHPGQPGVVMVNDVQVIGSAAWGVHTNDDEGVLIAFARLPATATPSAIAIATAALLLECAKLLPAD